MRPPPPPRPHQETARMGLEQDDSMMSYGEEVPDETHLEDSNVRYNMEPSTTMADIMYMVDFQRCLALGPY